MMLRMSGSLAAALLVLTACVYDDGTPNRLVNGAVIGGLTGAALGNAIGQDDKSTIIGGVTGAAIGGAIGASMERQQRELNQQLAGSGAQVVNSGDHLRVILPEGVTFPTGSSVVNASFQPALREIARSLRAHPNSVVRVNGHTDNVGTAAFNMQLSLERALSVTRILVDEGVPAGRIGYSGRGFNEPVASNASASGRAMNRRVEIVITPSS